MPPQNKDSAADQAQQALTQAPETSTDQEAQQKPGPDPQLVAAPIALTRQLGQMVDKRINILRRIHETGSISEAARLANEIDPVS